MASRVPTEILELKGSYKKDPQRRRPPSPKSKNPVGDAPDYLDEAEAEIWYEIISISAPGVLVSSDRLILARLCQLEKEGPHPHGPRYRDRAALKGLGSVGSNPGRPQ